MSNQVIKIINNLSVNILCFSLIFAGMLTAFFVCGRYERTLWYNNFNVVGMKEHYSIPISSLKYLDDFHML